MNIKEIDKAKIAGTYGRNDVVIDHGKGAVCYDEDGNRYIDMTSGIGVNSLGFCDEGWVNAVTEQVNKLQHISNLYYTAPMAKVADVLTERTGLKKVFFSNSGAEANETAIKVARKYGNGEDEAKKYKIITLVNSFHGRTMATVSATGQDGFHKYFMPFVSGFEYCTTDWESISQAIDDETCAIMIEVVQGEGGVLQLDEELVKNIYNVCQEKDILLIVDEVQTGIGRTGTLFAYEHFGIQPDIVTFAKGIGGGLPMGGVILGERCAETLKPGDHGSTFGGNPVACAGAYEVLSRVDDDFLSEVNAKAEYIRNRLSKCESVESITGMGLMIGIKLKDKEAKDVVGAALKKGVLLLTAKDKVRMLPPLTITMAEIDEALDVIEELI